MLVKLVEDIAKKENIEMNEETARFIAKRGDGAFRDTLGILERMKEVRLDQVEKVFSISNHEITLQFISSLVSKNLENAIKIINQVKQNNHSISDFLQETIETCRLVLLTRFAPEFAATISNDLNPDRLVQIKKWASEKNLINSELLVEFLKLLDEVKKTSMPEIPVELALIRILGNNDSQKAL
jgi:DNA polymerase-3 subunit gamma/tau